MTSTRSRENHSKESFSRTIWHAGGGWERFYILLPAIWAAYSVLVVAWLVSSYRSFDVVIRFLAVAVSIVVLIDAWITPILSASVLRAIAAIESSPANSNTVVLARYLESLDRNGRWIRGNLLSSGILAALFLWSLVSIWLRALPPMGGDVVFFTLYIPFLALLLWAYERELLRFARQAAAKGYPLQLTKRRWIARRWSVK